MIVEIVNHQGKVSYTRPHDHPDVLEALNTPGYSVRGSEPANTTLLQRTVRRGVCPYCGIDAESGPYAHAKREDCIRALKNEMTMFEIRLKREALKDTLRLNFLLKESHIVFERMGGREYPSCRESIDAEMMPNAD